VIVQRALAAKDIGHARGATLMAGYLKFLPLFIIIMPGMISRVLFTGMIVLLLSIYQLQVIGILKRRFNKLDLDNSQKVFL
jgi:sodium/myo-inositol cotransporter 3